MRNAISNATHTIRVSQWGMCLYSIFDSIESALYEMAGQPLSRDEEEFENV